MRARRGEDGVTVVELIAVVVISVVCAGLLAATAGCPPLSRARQAARRVQCSSNIRQLGLAVENYNVDYRALPSVHRNLWWLTSVYLGSGVSLEGDETAEAPEYYRCPQDRMLTDKKNGCSYAPNYEDVDPFAAEAGDSRATNGDQRNRTFSPYSNYKLSAGKEPTQVVSPVLTTKSLSSTSPSTILLIELWDPDNRAYFHDSDGQTAQAPIVKNGQVQCSRPALEDYTGPGAGTISGTEWALSSGGQKEQGAFYSLKAFADEAKSRDRDLDVNRRAYHAGRINVLFADQHVESLECSKVFQSRILEIADSATPLAPPTITVHNPFWTRTED